MHYIIVSFSYKNAPLEVRERLVLSDDEHQQHCMNVLLGYAAINEVIIENTCNRIEILASVKDLHQASEVIFDELHKRSKLTVDELQGRADIYTDEGAIHHLFAVASSLDSLVVGETQIVGQLRDAFKFSLDNGYCGQKLSQAMQYAFKCAAEVRQATNISSKPVSIASIAVLKAKEAMGSLDGVNALVIGSGDMSRIACQHLINHGAEVTLINRTKEKAHTIADEVGRSVIVEDYENLQDLINQNRLLFTATSAKNAIITDEMVMSETFHRYWFDLAVPRDIAPLSHSNIEVIVVDDLEDIAKSNIEFRKEEAKNSYSIIGRYTQEFFNWLQSTQVEPLIKNIYEKAMTSAQLQSDKALAKGFIPASHSFEAQKVAEQSIKHFLHSVTANIREIADKPEADGVIEALNYLFDIDEKKQN